MIASYGAGAVVAASDQHFDWAQKELGTLRATQLFSARGIGFIASRIANEHPGWELGGPHLRFLCCSETLRDASPPSGVKVRLLSPPEFKDLYERRDLPNVLSRPDAQNTDRIVAGAYRGGSLVAAAGASEDAPGFWQIGVDTLPVARRSGAATLVVSILTAHLLNNQIAPYYSTLIANVTSQPLAGAVGYWPAWLEMEARPITS